MAILRQEESREERRQQLIAEAEGFRRRHAVPDQDEVLAEMQRLRESLPKGLKTDSTELLREARGWYEPAAEPVTDVRGILIGDVVPDGGKEVAILRQDDTREARRREILEEAEEFARRHPPATGREEVLERIRRRRLSIPRNPNAPDAVELIREDRDR